MLKGSRAAGCFANSGKTLNCESSGNRGFGRSREHSDSGVRAGESGGSSTD